MSLFFDKDDFDFINGGLGVYNPIDHTKVMNNFLMDKGLDGISLTVGEWRLHITNPNNKASAGIHTSIKDTVKVIDPVKGVVDKKYEIVGVEYDLVGEMIYVDIKIYQNPIPILLIYGAIAVGLTVIGAMALNSILVKVEQLFTETTGLLNSTGSKMIILVFLIPLLSPFLIPIFKKVKIT